MDWEYIRLEGACWVHAVHRCRIQTQCLPQLHFCLDFVPIDAHMNSLFFRIFFLYLLASGPLYVLFLSSRIADTVLYYISMCGIQPCAELITDVRIPCPHGVELTGAQKCHTAGT
jgi:hypothetical protein